MSVTSGIVLYAVIWFMTLFMVLPLWVKSQEEAGEVEPGTPAGAPDEPMMKKKLIWTSVIATCVWIGAVAVIESGVITIADIASVFGRTE